MSAPSRRVVLAAEAREDLRDVLAFTEQQWGIAQRRTYQQLFATAFAELARFPELGRARPELGPTTRSHRVRQHVVYYRATERELRVLRIVHVRRAFEGEIQESLS